MDKYTNLFPQKIEGKMAFWLRKMKMLPFVLFGDRMKEKQASYKDLRRHLRQARIPISYEMYLSGAIFYSIVAGLLGAILGLIISYLLVYTIGLPAGLTKLTISPSLEWLLKYRNLFLSLFIVVLLSIVLGGITYVLFLIYPQFRAGERKGEIDKNLPYAVTFMYALSRGGMNVIKILRLLSECKDTYGEVSKEVEVILRDMDYFGSDLKTALHNICEITPSEKFQDLIYNLLTVIESGGSISTYFRDKSEQYIERARVEQKGFLETLGLIAESYVTAFVAGPLFIIILGVMMSVMGSKSQVMLYAIVYAVIPIGSIMFVVLIDMITPGSTREAPLLPTEKLLKEVEVIDGEEKGMFEKFIKSRQALSFRRALVDPLKPIREKPINALFVSLPVALIFLIISIFQAPRSDFVGFIDDRLVLMVYILIGPLAFFYELKMLHDRRIQTQIPDFLKKLASTNETGMTLKDSIKIMTRADIGALSKDIKKIWKDIEWGMAINEALTRFANRVRTFIVARAITLLTQANKSSGDIGEVLMVAARDAATEQELKRERSINMLIYIVIIYISFIVFIGIIYIISTTFLTEMVKAGEKVTTSGAGGVPLTIGRDTLALFNRIFFHAAVIQGFCSGLIAGVMGEGSLLSGLKHSLIMITIGYLLFILFVL